MSFDRLDLEPATTMDRAAEELRRALFEGELAPGTPLREIALADSLNVSRSTVREVLGVLVGEGLATRVAHKGTVVRELDHDAVVDVCRSRIVLESAGIRARPAADPVLGEDVRRALAAFTDLAHARDPSIVALNSAHLAIHRGLVALVGSQRLVAAAESLYDEIRLALANVDRIQRNADEQVLAHTRLVDLLDSGDTEATLAELTDHLCGAQRSLLASLDQ